MDEKKYETHWWEVIRDAAPWFRHGKNKGCNPVRYAISKFYPR